jgi:hypothetical protein
VATATAAAACSTLRSSAEATNRQAITATARVSCELL